MKGYAGCFFGALERKLEVGRIRDPKPFVQFFRFFSLSSRVKLPAEVATEQS